VDFYVKKQVLQDAVELVIHENQSKKFMDEVDKINERFKSFARVYPSKKEDTVNTELYKNIKSLMQTFMRLSRAELILNEA